MYLSSLLNSQFLIFITLFGLIFLEPTLRVLGAGSDIMPYAKQFAFVILAGSIFQNISFGLNAAIRSQGNPKFAMTTMLLGALINFIANPIFIFIFSAGATIITTIGFTLVHLFPRQIMTVFNDGDIELLNLSARGLVIFLAALPIVGVAIICTNYYQAVAKAKLSMFLSLLRQVILLIPLILIIPGIFKLDGVWMAQPIADFLSALITIIFISFEFRKLSGLENDYIIISDLESTVET